MTRTRTALGGVLVLIGGLLLAAGQALIPGETS